MVKKIILIATLIALIFNFSVKVVSAQTTCKLEVSPTSIRMGDKVTIKATGIVVDGNVPNNPDNSAFYINVPETWGRYYIPGSQIKEGSFTIELSSTEKNNRGFYIFAEGTANTIQLVRDTGPFSNHPVICTSFQKVTPSRETCTLNTKVTTNQNGTFNLGVAINIASLLPNTQYVLVVDRGMGNIGDINDYFTTPAKIDQGDIQQRLISGLDSGHQGKTYDVYVKRGGCQELTVAACAVTGCTTRATFSASAPTGASSPEKNIPETAGAPTDVLCADGKSINTAIGCVPFTSTSGLINFILRWALGIAGGIAFLLILFAGFQIMTSRGDPQRLKAGQELLTSAIAGLALLIFSIFILRVIGFNILNITLFR